MARKKEGTRAQKNIDTAHVEGLRAEVLEQPITDTLTGNYMPYAMSVIVSRAIRRSTASSRHTGSCCTRCTKWAC